MRIALPPYGYADGVDFGPSKPQKAFHALTAKYVYLRGGAGSGKSHAGSREFITRILEAYAARPVVHGKVQGVTYVAGAPSRALTEAGPWTHLTQWLEELQIRNGYSIVKTILLTWPRKIILINGDIILVTQVRSAEEFAGWTMGGAWLDEVELAQDPLATFKAANNRLRDKRVPNWIVVTSTPRAGASMATHFSDRVEQGDPEYQMMVAGSASNPGLPAGYVEGMRATMSAREAAMMIDGDIVAASGTVYALEFSRRKSISRDWKWHGGPQKAKEYFLAIDNPPSGHCLFVEFDKSPNTYTVFDEVMTDADQPDQFFSEIQKRCLDKWGIRPDHIDGVYIDAMPPHCRQLAYRKYWPGRVRYRVVHGHRRDKEVGIDTVRWALCDANGRRRVLFAPHLLASKERRGVIKSLENYTEIQTSREGTMVPTGRHDNASPWGHSCDALRYLIWIRESHRRLHDAT